MPSALLQIKQKISLLGEIIYGALSSLCGIIFTFFLAFTLLFIAPREETLEKQKLVILVPIPARTPLSVAMLLLGNDDGALLSQLWSKCKMENLQEKTILHYFGPRIYFPSTNSFLIEGHFYHPKQIQVISSKVLIQTR